MKSSLASTVLLLTAACHYVAAFAPSMPSRISQQQQQQQSQRFMFSGAGEAAPKEDNAEEGEKAEAAAKAMGMSLAEYNVAMNARLKLATQLDETKVTAGKKGLVEIERDINNPPKDLTITITDEGKAEGKEAVSKTLVAALKKTADDSRVARTEAQKTMMAYIGDKLKQG